MATAQLLLRRVSSAFSTTTPLRSPLRRSTVSSPRFQHRASMASAAAPLQKVQIQREDTTFDAYVVGKENAPGIVVLQEWWGVDYEIKNHATHISQIGGGYRALIPDLYRGKVALDVAEAQHLMEGLDWQGAIKDIQASVNWLKANGSPKGGSHGCNPRCPHVDESPCRWRHDTWWRINKALMDCSESSDDNNSP